MKYKIIICPNSSEESDFHELLGDHSSFDSFQLKAAKSFHSMETYEFETNEELDAFIKGYNAGVGYLGDGAFVTSKYFKQPLKA